MLLISHIRIDLVVVNCVEIFPVDLIYKLIERPGLMHI